MAGPDRDFWQQRFEQHNTPWDRGRADPRLVGWIAEGAFATGMRVAVPGCGSGHDVAALAAAGCAVTGIDYAPAAIELARARLDARGLSATLACADVQQWQPDVPLDAVFDQTCWCALHPDVWARYASQLHAWLRPGGRLHLLAVQCLRPGAAEGRIEGPPYHTDVHALRALLPAQAWQWPAPPYERCNDDGPLGVELAIVLTRRG